MRAILVSTILSAAVGFANAADKDACQTEDEKSQGFVGLFDGRTLEGWQGATEGYVAKDGKLLSTEETRGKMYTVGEYADFILRFEFKLAPGGNHGIGIRCPLTQQGPAYAGMEIQILDDSSPTWANLKPYQYHGSIYGLVPAVRGHLKPVGQWNAEEITCRGRKVTVKLNGTTIVDADLDEVGAEPADGREHPGVSRTQGHIGLLGHRHPVEFRNIRVKVLKPAVLKPDESKSTDAEAEQTPEAKP